MKQAKEKGKAGKKWIDINSKRKTDCTNRVARRTKDGKGRRTKGMKLGLGELFGHLLINHLLIKSIIY
jgi:hypothetical protein